MICNLEQTNTTKNSDINLSRPPRRKNYIEDAYESLHRLPNTLTVITLPSEHRFSLNNVTVTAFPIFNDGSLIICFGIDRFLNPYFRISGPIRSYSPKNLGCLALKEIPD
ncbi:hypothetical protein FF2_024795 [Malus domestica]